MSRDAPGTRAFSPPTLPPEGWPPGGTLPDNVQPQPDPDEDPDLSPTGPREPDPIDDPGIDEPIEPGAEPDYLPDPRMRY